MIDLRVPDAVPLQSPLGDDESIHAVVPGIYTIPGIATVRDCAFFIAAYDRAGYVTGYLRAPSGGPLSSESGEVALADFSDDRLVRLSNLTFGDAIQTRDLDPEAFNQLITFHTEGNEA
ncbi:MAG: hypothetical protein ACR2LF_10790 [Jatrophihabitantaceae bacterium]